MKLKPFYIFQALIILAIAAAIVNGFVIVGSPSQERSKRLDDQRSNDLSQISSAIEQYYNLNGRHLLPPTLVALRSEPNVYVNQTVDPRTGVEYTYIPSSTSTTSYQLCAQFETDTGTAADASAMKGAAPVARPYAYPSPGMPPVWWHGIGNTCFTFTVAVWPNPPKP